jgi:hypothetical membrane protein
MQKLKFYLVKLPLISITIFLIFCVIASFLYPGSEKEIINYQSDSYSFTHNFLSELGSFKTNTDEKKESIIKKNNLPSMLLFNIGLILIGATISLFYLKFNQLLVQLKESKASIFYSKITKMLGVASGIMFSGVGVVPHDLNFEIHVFFANGGFLLLFFLSVFHTLSIFKSRSIKNKYSLGYLIFCNLLFIYLFIIFLGPEIGPNRIFSENDLILQVLSQKLIVLSFVLSILSQVYVINKLLISS